MYKFDALQFKNKRNLSIKRMKKIYNSNWLFKLTMMAAACLLFAGTATAQLSGSYTIDAGGTGDFLSFTELEDTLKSDGVSGAVTVDVLAGSGPYTEDFKLTEITGASSSNTITINGNDEKITFNGQTLGFNGTDYITFNDLIIESTSTSAARIIRAHSGINNMTFDGCEVIANGANSYGGWPAYYQSAYFWFGNSNYYYNDASDEVYDITINDCKLWKGSSSVNNQGKTYGIYFATAYTSEVNLTITNNDIQDIGQFAMYLRKVNGGLVENNHIHNENNSANTYIYAIYVYNYFLSGSEVVTISHNNIHDIFTSNRSYAYASVYGIYAYGYYAGTNWEIHNNVIALWGPYYQYGIYNYGYNSSGDMNVSYNTIRMDGNVSYAYTRHYGMYFYYISGGDVVNNIIVDETANWGAGNGGSWLIYIYQSGQTFDHNSLDNESMMGSAVPGNVYYAYNGGNRKEFTDWTNDQGGSNSVNHNPNFTDVAGADFTPQSIAMANAGTPTTITEDLTYSTRSGTTPDVGAIEYFVDIEVVSVDMTGGNECAPYTEDVVVTLQNNGPNDISGVPMQYTINGGAPVMEIVTTSITAGGTMQFTFAQPANLYGSQTHDIDVSVVGADDVPANSDGSHTITTTASPWGGDLAQGATWNGYFNNGSMGDPDVTVKDHVIEYDITRPDAYMGSAPGTSTSGDYYYTIQATTMSGVDVTGFGFSLTNNDETLTVDPDQALADSTIFMNIIVMDNNTGCDTSFGRYLYVPHTPEVDFTEMDICLGDVAQFKNTSTLDGDDYMLNTWDFDDPDPAVTDDNSDILDGFWSYTTYGSADVTLTVVNGQYPLFEYSITKSITVTPKPEVDYKVLNACEGSDIVFDNNTALPAGITGTITYDWDFNGEGSSTDEDPTFMFSTPGQRVVTLTASANGCDATLSKNAYQFENPVADWSSVGECNFVDVEFVNETAIPNDANYGLAWDFGDGGISRLENPSHAFATPGTKTVTLTATSEFGCVSMHTSTVELKESPEADFDWDAACNLTPINFTRTGSVPNGGTGSSYAWDFNGESVSGMENPSHLFSNVGPKTVSLTISDLNGCSSSITKEVNVVLQAVADFEVADVCEGDEAVFTNKSSVAAGDLEYMWSFGENNATSEDLSPRHAYDVTGNTRLVSVTLQAIVPGGCSDEITLPLTVNAAPDASFTAETQGRTVIFDGPSGNSIYQWRFGNGASATSEDVNYTYTNVDEGTFEVCLATKNAECWSEECNLVTINLAGIEDLTENNDMISVYPNPTTGSFNLEVENASDDMVVKVADILGNELNVEVINNLNGKFIVNMSAVADGVYFVQVKNGDFYATKRITVSK